jgi:hypothetical protein
MWKIYRPQNLNCKFADKKMEEDQQTSKKLFLSLSPTTLLHILSSKFLSCAGKMP